MDAYEVFSKEFDMWMAWFEAREEALGKRGMISLFQKLPKMTINSIKN